MTVFTDNSEQVKAALKRKLLIALEEGGALFESGAMRLTRVDTSKLKGSWGHIVDEGAMEVSIGNTEENALWEEYGTGEYALEGDGRKTAWLVPAESLSPKWRAIFPHGMLTRGKKPQRMLYNAYQRHKEAVKKRTQALLARFNA